MKRILTGVSAFLLFALLLPMLCLPAAALGYDSAKARENTAWNETVVDIKTFIYGVSDVTEINTNWYGIFDAEGLVHFSELINDSDAGHSAFRTAKVCLCASIDMNGMNNFVPIGNGTSKFTATFPTRQFNGTFDGRGYVIDNLVSPYCGNESNGIAYVSLFGAVGKTATIQNVVMGSGCDFTYAGSYSNACVASLAARVEEGAAVTNVLNLAPVSGGVYCGGIIARIDGTAERRADQSPATLTDSTNAGAVSGKTASGGLVGIATGNLTVRDCRVNGSVSGIGSVGSVLGKSEQSVVKDYQSVLVSVSVESVLVADTADYSGAEGNNTSVETDGNCQQGADPIRGVRFHGVQLSEGEETDGKKFVSVRFVASLERETDYTAAGFRMVITNTATDQSAVRDYACKTLFTSLLGQTAEETVLYTAESLRGCDGYLFAATVRNIPMSVNDSFTFAISPYARIDTDESTAPTYSMTLTRTAKGAFTVIWNS